MFLTLKQYKFFKCLVLAIDILPPILFLLLLVSGNSWLAMGTLVGIVALTSSTFVPVPILSILNIIIIVVTAAILVKSKKSVVEEGYRSALVLGVILFSLFTALYLFLFFVNPITLSH